MGSRPSGLSCESLPAITGLLWALRPRANGTSSRFLFTLWHFSYLVLFLPLTMDRLTPNSSCSICARLMLVTLRWAFQCKWFCFAVWIHLPLLKLYKLLISLHYSTDFAFQSNSFVSGVSHLLEQACVNCNLPLVEEQKVTLPLVEKDEISSLIPQMVPIL